MKLKQIKIFFLSLFLILFSSNLLAAYGKILVPKKVINAFLVSYSPAEKRLIKKDLVNIRDLCMSQAKRGQKKQIYVATAGGPGASKSTILESYLHNHPGFVYVDPDQRALKFMINTYWQGLTSYDISKTHNYRSLLRGGYTKWRGGSNYIANTILNEAFAKKMAIAHGTTATNKLLENFYKKLRAEGYKIILLLCGSTMENRSAAIAYRQMNQSFIQSTRGDTVQKVIMFYENFPIYFKYADEIQFFWIDDFEKGWTKVAVYAKGNEIKELDKDFDKFKESYKSFRMEYPAKKLPEFEALPPVVKGK